MGAPDCATNPSMSGIAPAADLSRPLTEPEIDELADVLDALPEERNAFDVPMLEGYLVDVLPFSCKGRGVCPSCNARRMVETTAHLTDRVLPDLPLRQWVLAVPKRLRYFLQRDPDLQGAALRLFLRAVASCLRAHSPGSGPAARLAAVAFIHRFGSRLNAQLHFHCVVIDGVFEPAPANGVLFHAASVLDATAITQVQAQVRQRLLRVFVRRGLLPVDVEAREMAQAARQSAPGPICRPRCGALAYWC